MPFSVDELEVKSNSNAELSTFERPLSLRYSVVSKPAALRCFADLGDDSPYSPKNLLQNSQTHDSAKASRTSHETLWKTIPSHRVNLEPSELSACQINLMIFGNVTFAVGSFSCNKTVGSVT